MIKKVEAVKKIVHFNGWDFNAAATFVFQTINLFFGVVVVVGCFV